MDSQPLECPICKKRFTQKSSLVRHSKRCTRTPTPSLRQKSCRRCTSSKTRCDLQRPSCSRCLQREALCEYAISGESAVLAGSSDNHDPNFIRGPSSANERSVDHSREKSDLSIQTGAPNRIEYGDSSAQLQRASSSRYHMDVDVLLTPEATSSNLTNLPLLARDPLSDFSLAFSGNSEEDLNSVSGTLSFIDTTRTTSVTSPEMTIGDNWMLPLLPPADTTPPLVRHSMEVLLRVLRTWPRILAKEFELPPMIHTSQISCGTIPQPLANCFALCKMWAGQYDGASEIVKDTVLKEMKFIFDRVCRNLSPNCARKLHMKQNS